MTRDKKPLAVRPSSWLEETARRLDLETAAANISSLMEAALNRAKARKPRVVVNVQPPSVAIVVQPRPVQVWLQHPSSSTQTIDRDPETGRMTGATTEHVFEDAPEGQNAPKTP